MRLASTLIIEEGIHTLSPNCFKGITGGNVIIASGKISVEDGFLKSRGKELFEQFLRIYELNVSRAYSGSSHYSCLLLEAFIGGGIVV